MKKNLWALLDDRMGSVGQARGILQAIGNRADITEKKLVYTKWAKLPNFLRGKSFIGVNKIESDKFLPPYPDLILSTSRRTLPVARMVKKLSGNKTKIIQLMHPGNWGINDIDLVILPRHDAKKSKGDKFFMITGCPHRVTTNTLNKAKKYWTPVFNYLERPFTSVIIGGAIKGGEFSVHNAKLLGERIKDLHKKTGGSILITTSRRTGEIAQKAILDEIKDIPMHTFLWGDKNENPYMGYLACADKIIITGDSVSMCSEACGTGKPVLIFEGNNWLSSKHLRFVKSLCDEKFAISINDDDALAFSPSQTLDTANQIADKILSI